MRRMADVLARPWFTSLFVKTTYDAAGQSRSQPLKEFQFGAILVLAHMDADDVAVDLLHETLRGYVGPNMAVAFAAGRTAGPWRSRPGAVPRDDRVPLVSPRQGGPSDRGHSVGRR